MKRIPIVFSIDRNVIVPFSVCVSSLLRHAEPETFYELFVLHNAEGLDSQMRDEAGRVAKEFPEKCSLTFIDVGAVFAGAFEVRGITLATYYRLLIPRLLPGYDRVIYADVDIIFRADLSDLFNASLVHGELIAGVREADEYEDSPAVREVHRYYHKIGCDPMTCVNAGMLVMNLKAMRDEGIVDEFLQHTDKKYMMQDQDIINIVCRDRIEFLPLKWNYTALLYRWAHCFPKFTASYGDAEICDAEQAGTVHYTGDKPWAGFCPRSDLWWLEFRNSPVFDPMMYFEWQQRVYRLVDKGQKYERLKKWYLWLQTGKKRKND